MSPDLELVSLHRWSLQGFVDIITDPLGHVKMHQKMKLD